MLPPAQKPDHPVGFESTSIASSSVTEKSSPPPPSHRTPPPPHRRGGVQASPGSTLGHLRSSWQKYDAGRQRASRTRLGNPPPTHRASSFHVVNDIDRDSSPRRPRPPALTHWRQERQRRERDILEEQSGFRLQVAGTTIKPFSSFSAAASAMRVDEHHLNDVIA